MSVFQNPTPIMDTQDKPVAFTNPCAARAAIKAIEDVMDYRAGLHDAGGVYHLVPDARFDQKPLTVPERAIVAAFAAHFEKYTIGMERGATVKFPKVISSPSADLGDMMDIGFESEARAYMFAGVVEHAFALDAEVIEAPAGDRWLVSVSAPRGIDGDVFEQLRGACMLATKYRFEYAEDTQDDADSQERPQRRESVQGAILARLDAIMERLPVVAEAQPKGRGIEALIPTGKPGKKEPKKTA